MVNLSSGDMSYVLPVMDVDGFPVALSYHGGIPLDLESTWVGLGWNLNTGAINRGLNATPDDWRGGNSLDFLRYQDSDEIFTINVGVGVATATEVGVGMSWGSNKSLTGSVYASAAGVSASIDTDGNYSIGLQAGFSKGGMNFGGGVTMSGNVNSGEKNFSVGAGVRFSNGLTVGLGTSLSGGGASLSLGYSNGESGNKGVAGAGSISMSSFSKGDWDISSKGWYIPIQIHAITFGFGKQKVTYSLRKSYSKKGYGFLYGDNQSTFGTAMYPDGFFSDYQNRYVYGDVYEQALPQSEKEFIGDYDEDRVKLNFSFAGYDNYDINATGVTGNIKPVVYDNASLIGMGYAGSDPKSTNDGKQRIYYHRSNISNKSINSINKIHFYFDGQFVNNQILQPLVPVFNNNNSTGNTLANNLSQKPTVNNTKFQQGNYVEVFTNDEIKNGQANGLLIPENLPNSSRTSSNNFKPEGIGGYKITSTDGKTYHFSLPVYQFEMVQRNLIKDNSEDHVNEKRQYTPYATHWLLTAITGPDYYDTNNNNIADEEDYGYWVRLEHGKWSDGYVWRNPTDKDLKDYTTNIENRIGEKDFGYYQFGRKQLYYLDKIVSRDHTAFFVKDLRYDSVGCDLTYDFTAVTEIDDDGLADDSQSPVYEPGFTYKQQMQLMLKKIVLVKNEDATVFEATINNGSNPLQLNVGGVADYVNQYTLSFYSGGGFDKEYGNANLVKINQEQNVIDVKDFQNFDYSKAAKVVEFDYNYNLAVKDHNYSTDPQHLSNGSPGVIKDTPMNPNHGKLTLKTVRFLGRNNFDYMPPYQFDYDGEYISSSLPYTPYPPNAIAQRKGIVEGNTNNSYWESNYLGSTPSFNVGTIETPIQNIRAKDEWGFFKDRPQVWTMTKIITPTGAKIEFEHEEDDYYTEAFSRRYWMEGLQFSFDNLTSSTFDMIIKKNEVENLLPAINFNDYFSINDPFYIDLWLCVIDRDWGAFECKADREKVNIVEQSMYPLMVSNNQIVLRLNRGDYIEELDDSGDLFGHTFRLNSNQGSEHPFAGTIRNDCPPKSGSCGGDGFYLTYKLLASKVPSDETGGGLRVKSITLKDENNNSYKTSYYYNVPGTNKVKNVGNYKSSGITSYSPVKGTKFIPYQSELPSPGVMYEYVTMVAENSSGGNLGETQYRFYVLRPVFDIFNENIIMYYDDGTAMFKATVQDHNDGSGYFDSASNKKIQAKSINLEVNTSLVGQFRSIEEFNTKGQLMTKTEKSYTSGLELKNKTDLSSTNEQKMYRGTLKESFQSMKSVFNTDSDDLNPVLQKRLLSVSSRVDYPSALTKVTNVTSTGKVTEWYKGSDSKTGAFNIVEKLRSDGKKVREERVPAYTKYPEMGSKVADYNNKNMLTQEAMTISSINTSGSTWKTLGASITTWNDSWKYRDEVTGVDQLESSMRVWRKHKTFVWKENVSISNGGTYITTITKDNNQFDWGTGQPLDNKWQKLSEITRYTRWSSPIETKDINGNFASTKMGDKGTKVLISGNARYTEMYYSGAEYVKSGNLFDGEVKGANFRTSSVAHTGKYSVKAQNLEDKVFEVSGSSGDESYYTNQDNYNATFRPGKYKISFWAYKSSGLAIRTTNNYSTYASVKVNGQDVPYTETVDAGCWQLQNYIIDILPNTSYTISVGARTITGSDFYDDFRMHPIASTVSSYVYDQQTDELSYILDGNNIGSAFKYDDAGRLMATYTEMTDHISYTGTVTEGGFKLVNQYRQKYKGANDDVNDAHYIIYNCYLP
jgi:hypothetical protein